MNFEEFDLLAADINPFKLIGKDWMLVTAGDSSSYNTMLASWGGLGVMWGKNVAECMIRPSRRTLDFVESNELFTLSFFDEQYRDALNFCGTHSGRDYDKAKETGLVPWFTDGTVAFEQAKLVLVCRKLYSQNLDTNLFIDKSCLKWYEKDGVHKVFVGEIVKAYIKR